MWRYQNTDELYHHGILGMRWGHRRYQNKDGSLTPAGRKRANKLLKEYSKVTGKKVIVKKNTVKSAHDARPKTVKEMSMEELQSKITRREKEIRYRELYPEKVSAGKKFVTHVASNVVIPSIEGAAKTAIQGKMTKLFNEFIDNNKKKD